jgi:hypothetical protein
MKVAGPKLPPIGEFIRLLSIDVYGRLDDGLVEGLRQKAKMLGSGTVRVHSLHAGSPACLRLKFSSCTAAQEDKRRRLGYSVIFNHQRYTCSTGAGDRGMPGDGTRLDQRPLIPIRRPMLKTPPAASP